MIPPAPTLSGNLAKAPAETKIVLCVKFRFSLWSVPEFLPRLIRERWPAMQVVFLEGYDALSSVLPDTDIFVGFTLTPEQLAAARQLRWMHVTAAGVAHLLRADIRARNLVITNSRGIHAIPMAEHTLGLMIAMAHKFPAALRYQQQRLWAQQRLWEEQPRPSELHGAVLLLVGLGAVGSAVACYAKACGMRVRAVTRTGRGDASLAERIYPAGELRSALPDADYLVLAAPDTPATQQMIGAKQLALMKPTAVLVNVARGSLVDEAALVEALRQRTIAGAALDVTTVEPLRPESPLWSLENVFLTPHTSAASEMLWVRQGELLMDNLERWFAGRELLNLVDLERGY
jgi:phosphoglycerate dehydrogenase-like enzyme